MSHSLSHQSLPTTDFCVGGRRQSVLCGQLPPALYHKYNVELVCYIDIFPLFTPFFCAEAGPVKLKFFQENDFNTERVGPLKWRSSIKVIGFVGGCFPNIVIPLLLHRLIDFIVHNLTQNRVHRRNIVAIPAELSQASNQLYFHKNANIKMLRKLS
jgi:hypothetical protein